MTERPDRAAPLAVTLSNVKADRVKQVRALLGRSARSRAGQFVVEGPQGVRELVAHAPQRVRDVYLSESAHAREPGIGASALAAGLFVHLGTDEVLAAMSPDSQGTLAAASMWRATLEEDLPPKPQLVAVLNEVRDPGNVGTIIRVADSAGADALILAGETVDVFNPKVVRATAGSLFHLPVIQDVTLAAAAAALRDRGVQILATAVSSDDQLGSAEGAGSAESLAQPTAWLLGNESRGLSEEHLALVDHAVRIPIFGYAESMNVATAAAVVFYQSRLTNLTPHDAKKAPRLSP